MKQEVTTKKVFIRTLGCQMNVRDSEALLGLFLEKGYTQAQGYEDADIILLNTCSVREHAEHRVRSILGTLKEVAGNTSPSGRLRYASHYQVTRPKKKNVLRDTRDGKRKIIGLIGCMARSQGREIFERMPYVSLIVAPSSLHKIPEYVERLQTTSHKLQALERKIEQQNSTDFKKSLQLEACSLKRLRIIDLEDRGREEEFYHAHYRIKPDHAQVVISTGCSNHCSYCVVPFVRGELRLRSPKDIIDEVKRNVSLGIKKITLLGQNVNDYRYRSHSSSGLPTSFIDLLSMVDEIEGVEEIDFLTPHPKDTTKALFKLMAKSKKIKKYLHLPLQSGSDRILKLMNRGYTKKDFLALVDDYKSIVGGTIGTDIIVGFPTETEDDFQHTKDVLEKVNFMGAYIFKYSPRPNTEAQKLKDDVAQKVKEKRHAELLELQKKISSLEADKRGYLRGLTRR